MLTDDVKSKIREAYSRLSEARGLEPRWGQRQMIAEVSRALAKGAFDLSPPIAVIEAGTGTGKTIAYTIAAVPIAQAREKRLVISTATVALQEQLMFQDLPDIARHSGLEFSVVLAKGRRRYVCLARLDQALNQAPSSQTIPLYPDEYHWNQEDDSATYERLMDGLARGDWDGDRDNLAEAITDSAWFPVTSDHAQCTGRRCTYIAQCSFYKAREQLADADVIVTNHDLVLSDLSIGGGVVLPAPEDALYIFDEAHHLAEKAKNHSTAFCHLQSTLQWTEDTRKWLEQSTSFFKTHTLDALVARLMGHLKELADALETTISAALELEDKGQDVPVLEQRFEHGLVPQILQEAFMGCSVIGVKVGSLVERLTLQCEELLDQEAIDKESVEVYLSACQSISSRLELTQALWSDFGHSTVDSPPPARWIRYQYGNSGVGISCHSSPILASAFLQSHLWERAAGVVLTSASLTALGRFDRFKLHAGTPSDAQYVVVTSPFDYSRARLHIPSDLPAANDALAHTQALIERMPELLDQADGTLVLFSSRRQMTTVYEGLPSALQERILKQDVQSKKSLIEQHKHIIDAGGQSVLFGLASFAEGVDLPARYCEHVIIAKIPFSVPDDPREAALSEWVEAQGGNAFKEISVPDAGAKLLQACGRLLRTERDSGQITIHDPRLLTNPFGRQLLESLPAFTRI